MADSLALKCTRKLLMIDNALYNAYAYLYEHYYIMLRADPILAAAIEQMMIQVDDTRSKLRDLYRAAWYRDNDQFDNIGETGALIRQARIDVLGRTPKCQAYLNVLVAGDEALSRLLENRGDPSWRPLDSCSQSPQKSAIKTPSKTLDKSQE